MLKASPSGADKIQSFQTCGRYFCTQLWAASSWRLSLHRGSRMFLRLTKTS